VSWSSIASDGNHVSLIARVVELLIDRREHEDSGSNSVKKSRWGTGTKLSMQLMDG